MKKIILIIIIFTTLLIFGWIFLTQRFIQKIDITEQGNIKEFTIKAFKFGYEPNTLTVTKGDKVKLIIDNIDTLHGIRIPELNLVGTDVLEFTADKQGEFIWYCANFCGEGHKSMKGRLIVR